MTWKSFLILHSIISISACLAEGREYANGDRWTSLLDPCENCVCEEGINSCTRIERCPQECDHGIVRSGECCSQCTGGWADHWNVTFIPLSKDILYTAVVFSYKQANTVYIIFMKVFLWKNWILSKLLIIPFVFIHKLFPYLHWNHGERLRCDL